MANAGAPLPADYNMNCTQAVHWIASQIKSQQPPNTLPKVWAKGAAETTAIELLHGHQGSPCASKHLVTKYGFEPQAQSENRGAQSVP